MGNALDFLEKSKTKKRRGHHNSECKKKIDEYLEENEVVKCEDYTLIKSGVKSKGNRVNDMGVFKGSIPGINARRYGKKEPIPCKCCSEMFVPARGMRPLTSKEKESNIGELCRKCINKGSAWRKIVNRVGGIVEYNYLTESILDKGEVKKLTSLRDLYSQLDTRKKLNLSTVYTESIIYKVVEKAYKENENFTMRNSHYEFDF